MNWLTSMVSMYLSCEPVITNSTISCVLLWFTLPQIRVKRFHNECHARDWGYFPLRGNWSYACFTKFFGGLSSFCCCFIFKFVLGLSFLFGQCTFDFQNEFSTLENFFFVTPHVFSRYPIETMMYRKVNALALTRTNSLSVMCCF